MWEILCTFILRGPRFKSLTGAQSQGSWRACHSPLGTQKWEASFARWAEHPAAPSESHGCCCSLLIPFCSPHCFSCLNEWWTRLKNLVILAWCWAFLKAGFFEFRNKTKRKPSSPSLIPIDKKLGWSKSNYPCNDSWQHWQDRTMSTSPPCTPPDGDWQCPGWNLDPLLSNQIMCLHLNMLSS